MTYEVCAPLHVFLLLFFRWTCKACEQNGASHVVCTFTPGLERLLILATSFCAECSKGKHSWNPWGLRTEAYLMSSSPICINGSTRPQGFSPGRQTMKSKYVCLCQFQLQVLKNIIKCKYTWHTNIDPYVHILQDVRLFFILLIEQ